MLINKDEDGFPGFRSGIPEFGFPEFELSGFGFDSESENLEGVKKKEVV